MDAHLGFETSYAQMTIADLVIVCTKKLAFDKGHFLVIISQTISTNIYLFAAPFYSVQDCSYMTIVLFYYT